MRERITVMNERISIQEQEIHANSELIKGLMQKVNQQELALKHQERDLSIKYEQQLEKITNSFKESAKESSENTLK